MSNYKQTSEQLSLTKWYAAKLVQLFNDSPDNMRIKFHEVERTSLGDTMISEIYTNRDLEIKASDPDFTIIPYINLETFEQVPEAGHFTADEIYYAMACLYIAVAKREDNKPPKSSGTFIEE